MSFVLNALSGELAGRQVEVESSMTVGRADDCELVLEERRLSRRHARFFEDAGRWFVEDLGSPNGTFVNQRRIKKTELKPGDTITLCKSTFKVDGNPESPIAAAPEPTPQLVKPLLETVPNLESMIAEDYFSALGLQEETLHDSHANPVASLLEKTRNFALLHEVTKAMQRQHDPQAMLTSVLNVVLKVTGAERGYVILVEEDGTFTVPVEVGESAISGPPSVSQTVAQYVLRDGASVMCADAGADQRFAESESIFLSETRALIAAPMRLQEQVLGALVLQSSHLGQRFTEADLDLLSVVASTVGVGLQNLRLAQQREQTIVELKQAQAQLLATQERLIQSEQMAALGRLSSGIAHEVKNHLSPFMLTNMIAKKYAEDKEIQQAAEIMQEAQQHILDLVNEVRAFAQGHEQDHVPEPVDLVSVVEGILRFVRCDKALARARLEFEADAEPIVNLDSARFRQVLINLVKNAADAVPEGTRPHIRLRVQEFQGRAYLDVIDNGCGIPDEIAAQVFDPFFSTKGENGLGLGLDISRNIIRQHGGELGFSSQPDQGTTFRVRLPLAE